jgi:hypothetical protein
MAPEQLFEIVRVGVQRPSLWSAFMAKGITVYCTPFSSLPVMAIIKLFIYSFYLENHHSRGEAIAKQVRNRYSYFRQVLL